MKQHRDNLGKLFYVATLNDDDILSVMPAGEEWYSRRQIAELLWRSVSPSLAERLERMVGEGKLEKHVTNLANHRQMFWYRRGSK